MQGIKLSILLNRKDALPVADFQARWREEQGQCMRRLPGIRQAIQCHTLASEYDHAVPPDYDGIAEMWWDDRPAMMRALASPEYRAMTEGLRAITDTARALAVREVPILDRFAAPADRIGFVKYTAMLIPRMGVSLARLQKYWLEVHSRIMVTAFPTMHRYVQSHVLEAASCPAGAPLYGGLPEAWFDDTSAFSMRSRDPDARRRTGDAGWPAVCAGSHAIFSREVRIL